MKINYRWVICSLPPIIGLLYIYLSSSSPASASAGTGRYGVIRVVMDNNYPPYVFTGEDGKIQGMLIDQWLLWEERTGIRVEITALDWGEAQRRMETGEFDVIDTIFFTEDRSKIYDFSRPYADIEVSIFFAREIGGIHDAKTLKGFPVAVKRGDAAIDYLRSRGVDSLQEYPSYEAIIDAAKAYKVYIAVIDNPPALYFLYRKGIHERFRYSRPLYTGQFHRAVRKGDKALLKMVEDGFTRISPEEYAAIEQKWQGKTTIFMGPYFRYTVGAMGFFMLAVLAVVSWNRSLSRKVRTQTRALEEQIAVGSQRAEELRQSEEKYRSLFENVPGGIFQTGRDGRFVSVNYTLAELLGYDSPEEMLLSISDVATQLYVNPSERERLMAMLEKERVVRGFEMRFRRRDDGEVWVLINIRAVEDPEGGRYYEGTVEDITRRRQMETALRENEAFAQSLIRYLHDAVIILSWEGEILFANESAVRIVEGASPEDIIGRNMVNFLHPDSLQKAWEDSVAVRGGVEGFLSEYRLITVKGRDVWVGSVGGKIPFRGREANIVCLRDVTDHRQAMDALRDSEEKYRTVVENAMEAIFVVQDGRLVFGNRATCEFTGYSEVELLSRPFEEFLHPEDREMIFRRHETPWRSGGVPTLYPLRVVHRDGQTVWGELRAALVEWEERPATLSFLVDITERKRLEEERERLQTQLNQAQKMESVGRLAGGVAHDFNNMLQAIVGYTELAARIVKTDDPLARYIQGIRKAADHAAGTTQQLLAFARRQPVTPQVLGLNETVEGMLGMIRRLIGEDIDLTWSPGGKSLTVFIDPAQISHILVNLCINARDAIVGPGRITIETDVVDLDEAFCLRDPSCSPGSYAVMAVSDTGCGMDKEILANIFDPFYTTKEVGKGTGLGLAVVYGIVKQNKGYIKVYSEPGRGSTFRIYLPLHRQETARPVGADVDEGIKLPDRGTILVVEDEVVITEMMVKMLTALGYEVLAASSPADALRLAGDHHRNIDLLITDVVMPAMNGRELAVRVQSLRGNIKCIFMSGYTADIIAHHGVLDTNINFLQKPFSMETLGKKVREVLGS